MERQDYRLDELSEAHGEAREADASRTFFNRVYNWMASGLILTGAAAWYVGTNPQLLKQVIGNPVIYLVLVLLTFGMVMVLSWGLNKLSPMAAALLYAAYALLNGVTFAVIFAVYTPMSIYMAFFTTAGTFALTSLFGYMTKLDLSSIGGILLMALAGLIIGSVVNLFWANSTLYWLVTYGTVLVFVGLTAWDTQKLKMLAAGMDMDGVYSDTGKKQAIIGALALYLDFINLFLMLLRIFGGRRRN